MPLDRPTHSLDTIRRTEGSWWIGGVCLRRLSRCVTEPLSDHREGHCALLDTHHHTDSLNEDTSRLECVMVVCCANFFNHVDRPVWCARSALLGEWRRVGEAHLVD